MQTANARFPIPPNLTLFSLHRQDILHPDNKSSQQTPLLTASRTQRARTHFLSPHPSQTRVCANNNLQQAQRQPVTGVLHRGPRPSVPPRTTADVARPSPPNRPSMINAPFAARPIPISLHPCIASSTQHTNICLAPSSTVGRIVRCDRVL